MAMKKPMKRLLTHITNFGRSVQISKTRDTSPSPVRDMETSQTPHRKPAADSFKCPYCLSSNFVKRGYRVKKRERVQLYLCKQCRKVFTEHRTSGKHYPLPAVLAGLSLYNLGYSLESVCRSLNRKDNYNIQPTSLSNWIKEFKDLCRFSRLRPYALQRYKPREMVLQATLAHQQLFRYRFHRAKCNLIIREDIKHRRFGPLKELLEMVPVECPHQYFSKGLRASEAPMTFSKKQMIVRAKKNYANELCRFVLQSVENRYARHEALQKFMLYNDSVTVATEVPVFITRDDLEHLKTQLGFEMYPKPQKGQNSEKKDKIGAETLENSELPKLITGHIDFLQIRNGQIHILDYKPKAEKVRPIEQLTLYAMALSRLTGLRLFEFKCAWFDETDYFEFFPLHVLYKPRKNRRRKKVTTKEGTYAINEDREKIISLEPLTKKLKNYVLH